MLFVIQNLLFSNVQIPADLRISLCFHPSKSARSEVPSSLGSIPHYEGELIGFDQPRRRIEPFHRLFHWASGYSSPEQTSLFECARLGGECPHCAICSRVAAGAVCRLVFEELNFKPQTDWKPLVDLAHAPACPGDA